MQEKIAEIEITFAPPHELLDPIPGVDGSHIYRVRTEAGSVHLSGSSRGTDETAAFNRAFEVARRNGYTHYKMKNMEMDIQSLTNASYETHQEALSPPQAGMKI